MLTPWTPHSVPCASSNSSGGLLAWQPGAVPTHVVGRAGKRRQQKGTLGVLKAAIMLQQGDHGDSCHAGVCAVLYRGKGWQRGGGSGPLCLAFYPAMWRQGLEARVYK